MSNFPPLPVHVLPDGRRTLSTIDIADAIILSSGHAMRHDNLLATSALIAAGPCIEAAAAVVPGLYRDIAGRPRKMAFIGHQALSAMAVLMRGQSGDTVREFQDYWHSLLVVGSMPEIRLHRRLRVARTRQPKPVALAASTALPAPVAATSEAIRETRKLLAEYKAASASDKAGFAALMRQQGIDAPDPVVDPAVSTTEIAERLGLPVYVLANLPGFRALKARGDLGDFRLSVAPTSGKQVEVRAWNSAGVAEVEALVRRTLNSGSSPH